jgi:deazaflavin-dependent oxidoreductase (nitroreductase family)
LLLSHIGRRTGLHRYTVLEIIEYRDEGPEAIVMSAFGPNADWFRNIKAQSDPKVLIGSQRFTATIHVLDAEEAVAVLRRYEQRNRLVAPVIRFVLSRLLGWRYNSTDADRHRLVTELPIIALRPRS